MIGKLESKKNILGMFKYFAVPEYQHEGLIGYGQIQKEQNFTSDHKHHLDIRFKKLYTKKST